MYVNLLKTTFPGIRLPLFLSAFGPPQARLETSWRALSVPAKLKLDFLQKYCTLERALDLPRTAHLLEIASKAVPLREKVRHEYAKLEVGYDTRSLLHVDCYSTSF